MIICKSHRDSNGSESLDDVCPECRIAELETELLVASLSFKEIADRLNGHPPMPAAIAKCAAVRAMSLIESSDD